MQCVSLKRALIEQKLWDLCTQLQGIVPDIKHQYSSFEVDSEFLTLSVRGIHAFQIELVNRALELIVDSTSVVTVVDVGDSAGTHMQYLRQLHKDKSLKCIGVNVDEQAVRRIREKGLNALSARAEDLVAHGIKADVFTTFEVLEHLPNPIQFLKGLSYHTECRALVLTVPYVAQSRVGFHHIRRELRQPCNPENTHILELSPGDWRLLFMHAGWAVKQERLYLQYPRYDLFRLMRMIWRRVDFEGFWGAILVRDHTWSDLCSES